MDKSSLVAEQGHLIGRPGLVHIDLEKESDEIATVKVGGSAVTVMNGKIFFGAINVLGVPQRGELASTKPQLNLY